MWPRRDSVWNPEIVSRLESLWSEGKSARIISDILSCEFGVEITKNAVIGKAHRTRLPTRASPIVRPSGWQPPVRKTVKRKTRRKTKRVKTQTMLRVYESGVSVGLGSEERKRIAETPYGPTPGFVGRTCQWPIGDPRAPEFRFCDAPVRAVGQSYCAKHYEVSVRYDAE